jgi:hypothetical protein
MFNPRRMIPKLAVAALALTGCGDGVTDGNGGTAGDGGTAGNGGTAGTAGNGGSGGTNGALGEALDAFCVKLVQCTFYDTVGECVTYLTNYYDLGDDISSECAAALTSYFQCGEALSCPELESIYGNSCDDEWYAAYDVCY